MDNVQVCILGRFKGGTGLTATVEVHLHVMELGATSGELEAKSLCNKPIRAQCEMV